MIPSIGRSNKSIKKICFCVLFVIILVLQVLPLRVTAQTTVMAVDPATYVVSLNQTFQVNITITDVANCTGWEFWLYYRNAVLNCTGVTEGSFLSSGGPTFFYAPVNNTYNSTAGYVHAVCRLVIGGGGVPVDGSGLLAQVSFVAIGASSTTLHLAQTKLSDNVPPTGNPIPHVDSDGSVQVAGPPPDVFVFPANLTGPSNWIPINGTFTVNVSIACAPAFDLNLNYWQAGMSFNPSVLECINFTEGPFLARAGATVWQSGTIDNIVGLITPYGARLSSGVGANGNGTLAYISFRVKDTGSSPLVLQNVFLIDLNSTQVLTTVHSGVFELPPEIPKPPTAFFTYSPSSPYVNDTITFDATSSTANNANGTIVKYDWDFADSSQGQGMILDHLYSTAGIYNVTLVVTDDRNLTGSFSQLVTVIAIPVGASIDAYTQRGGRGLSESSDTFGPEEEIILYAYTTYDLIPVAGKVVTFRVDFPNGTEMFSRQIVTDNNGIAFFPYLVLAVPVFGEYSINATVTVGTKTILDICRFHVNWLVQVTSVVPVNVYGVPQYDFDRGEPVYLSVTIMNNRLFPTYALVSTTVQDYLTQPILYPPSQMYRVQPNQTVILLYAGQIPVFAYGGPAIVYTSAREGVGGQASPEVESVFFIWTAHPNVAVVNVTAATTDTYVGHSVEITINMLDKYYVAQDCNVTVYVNGSQIQTLNIVALPPWQEETYTCVWFTYGYDQGYYGISVVASAVPGESNLFDNTFTGCIVHLGPKAGPVHDVSVTDIASSKTVVGGGYSTVVNVTLHNEGDYDEICTLKLFCGQNATPFASLSGIGLSSGQLLVKSFNWTVCGFNYGNYTLTAVLDPVLNEADLDDNVGFSRNLRIGVPGDVSGVGWGVPDGVVNMRDIQYLILCFNTKPPSPNWKPNADVNSDNVVNMRDITIQILHFNQHG